MAKDQSKEENQPQRKRDSFFLFGKMTGGERRMLIGLVLLILASSGYRYLHNRQLEKDLQIISASTSSSPVSSALANASDEALPPLFAQKGSSKTPPRLINVNDADRSQLETLPGIGPVKAQAIIDYRQRYGPFRSVDELIKVKGIGPKTLEKIRPFVTISSSDPGKPPEGKSSKGTPSGKESSPHHTLSKEIILTSPAFKEG
ncbi:MAG: ComEA family DNA-binding protein, partial [bacterium]